MGTYMTIQLKDKYIQDKTLDKINEQLKAVYNYRFDFAFNSSKSLRNSCDYFNNSPEGKNVRTDLKRPVKPITLILDSPNWFRLGYAEIKISSLEGEDEAMSVIALGKWARDNASMIDKTNSGNYDMLEVIDRTEYIIEELGISTEIYK